MNRLSCLCAALTLGLLLPSVVVADDHPPASTDAKGNLVLTKCPKHIDDWLDSTAWPLASVAVGDEIYDRDALKIYLEDEDLEASDAGIVLAAELVAAKLNRALGVTWEPLDALIEEGDSALAGKGELPPSIDAEAVEGELPLKIAASLADYNNGDVIPGCPWVPSPRRTLDHECPKRAVDWPARSFWPLTTVPVGSAQWSRAGLENLMRRADHSFEDPAGALIAELAAARLNAATYDLDSPTLFSLLAESDSLLDFHGAQNGADLGMCSPAGLALAAQAAKLQQWNAGRTISECLPLGTFPVDLEAIGAAAENPRRCEGVWGFAELHTHIFAEHGWNQEFIEGTIDDLDTPGADPASTALSRCSGLPDHASLRFPYIIGMGVTTEELVAVVDHEDDGKASPGDTGLHLGRRNGFDDRSCLSACLGPGTCIFNTSETACQNADPGFCKDSIPGNVSVSAAIACNTKTNRDGCQSAGYCGATGSSLWSIEDDLDACFSNWPNCDAGDKCIKRDPLKMLECNDLNQNECSNHGDSCNWNAGCKLQSGSLTCGDLNQGDCNQYSDTCDWNPGSCSKDPFVLDPFECSDLDAADCSAYGECGLGTPECKHVSGSLTCSDLSRGECGDYNECSWIFGRCRNNVVGGSLTCGDLSQAHCGNHNECRWETPCERTSGSFTCGDLNNSGDCNQYGRWCDWDPGSCSKDPFVFEPFECNDLTQSDCGTYPECGWEESCSHPLGAPSLECSDLSLSECNNHFEDGGCGVRDCTEVNCEWNDWGECRWEEAVLPPHCGEDFQDWPAWDTPTHQQHWWGHLQDSWRRGLRIVSASILEVDPLGVLMPGGADRTPYQVIIDQLEAANDFASRHDWVEIALSGDHARQIAADGRLAMVLTLEANFPYCKERPCGRGSDEDNIQSVLATLDEYHALGVRSYQVVGHFDNQFSGVAIYNPAIHLMQWLYEEISDDGDVTMFEMAAAMNTPLENAFDLAAEILHVFDPLTQIPLMGSLFPVQGFDQLNDLHAWMALKGQISGPQCVRTVGGAPERCITCLKDGIACRNVIGLTPLGIQLLEGLIDRGMLIDIAHLSERGVEDVWTVAQSHAPGGTYPIYLSHGDPRETLPEDGHKGPHQEKTTPPWVLDIIVDSGGMFGMRTGPDQFVDDPDSLVPNDCAGSSKSFAQALTYLVDQDLEVGFALDMNGMIANAAPRFIDDSSRKMRRRGEKSACLGNATQQDIQQDRVTDDPSTPHTDEARYNTHGLGHIGLLGAYLDDLDAQGLSQSSLDRLYGSAEAFIRMWERIP